MRGTWRWRGPSPESPQFTPLAGCFWRRSSKLFMSGATRLRWPSFEPPARLESRDGDAMPRTLFEHLSPDTGAKRVLALDGGGVKGILTLGMLKVLEDELRRRAGDAAGFRLSDYYDLIGGTSTGAIIASALALGLN